MKSAPRAFAGSLNGAPSQQAAVESIATPYRRGLISPRTLADRSAARTSAPFSMWARTSGSRPSLRDADHTEGISITTLDQFTATAGIRTIDFLKVDTEGHEMEVLNGAAALLREQRIRLLMLECEPVATGTEFTAFAAIAKFLEPLSPRLFGIYDQQLDWNGARSMHYFNALFVSKDTAANRFGAPSREVSMTPAIWLALGCFAAGVLLPAMVRAIRSSFNRRRSDNDVAGPVDTLHYARKVGQFELFPAAGEIVFLGDSRVELTDWNEVLGASGIINRGISGDTTAGIVQRLDVSIPRTLRVCVLQAGVNDVWRGASLELVRAQCEQIVRYIVEQKGGAVLLTSVVFVDRERAALNARLATLNSSLLELAPMPNVHWLDLNHTLAPDGYLLPQFTDDGTHFTGAAYRAIAGPLRSALAEILAAGAA